MKSIFRFASLIVLAMILSQCDLNVIPADALNGSQVAASSDGLSSLLNGCYAQIKDFPDPAQSNNWYLRQYYHLSDFASDDILCAYKTEDDLINSFRYKDRTPEKSNINSFWSVSYKIVYGANVAIDIADKKGSDALTKQLKGEAYFLRAFATHNLVRLFAKPYTQSNASVDPGVIIRENVLDAQLKARASLKDTYSYITSSLTTAANLMSTNIPAERASVGFVSKYAAWAMLSRVYLYKGDYDNCIAYSDSVINSGIFTLTAAVDFPNYFVNAKTSPETIWLIPFNTIDDKREASVASMIYNGASCWGEEGVTPSIMEDMGFGTDMQSIDQRWGLIETENTGFKNGITLYYVKKYSNQDGSPTLSSPVMLRLAEMYLNRAEAYAQKQDAASALADINAVRSNRMIPPDGHTIDEYTFDAARDNITNANIMDITLKERRIELAFEGHRIFDLLRNKKDIIRNYWGFHLDSYNGVPSGSVPGVAAGGVVFHYNDPEDIYPIPSSEISSNKLCLPNN
jgi:hypothetical protein